MRRRGWIAAGTCLTLAMGALALSAYVSIVGSSDIKSTTAELEPAPAALVLGAMAKPDGTPSDVLGDRLALAVELYRSGKVSKLLLSGDHGKRTYDEVNCMRRYALASGVAPADVFCDHAGFSTYESLYRARDVFLVKRAIVVTQAFHLPRALFLARSLGIQAQGTPCDKRQYRARNWNAAREAMARVKAFVDSVILRPRPTYLGPSIPLDGDGRASWDQDRDDR